MAEKLSREKLDETLVNMFSNHKYANDYMFYAHMIGQCTIKLDDKMPAAAGVNFDLDHYNLFINPNEFDKEPLVTRLAILKHEMLHILNNHVARRGDRDHNQFNVSADCAINQMIDSNHVGKITQEEFDKYGAAAAAAGQPFNVGDDKWYFPHNFPAKPGTKVPKGLSSEQYYDLIDEDQMPKEEEQECQSCGGEGHQECESCGGSGEDGDGNECQNCQGSGQQQCDDCGGSGKQPGQGQDNGPNKMPGDHGKWQESEGDPDVQKDMTKNMLDRAMENTVKSRGNLPSGYSDYLAMFTRKAEVSWQKVLRGILGNKRVNSRRTIMRSDRRFPYRDDLRGKTKDRMFTLLLVSDVSGSVSDKALMSLWGEVRHICDVTKSDIDLIQVDTQPSAPEKLSKNTKMIERKACGGTVLAPALQMAKDHNIDYNAVVVTTDGYLCESDVAAFEKEKKKIIWLIEKDGVIMPEMERGRMKAFKLKE